jgi:sulfatase modifying factor 1
MRQTIRRFVCGVLVLCVALAANAALAEIEMVTVGNAGNAADTGGYGSVSYDYQMGKFEVTAGQYTAFLNSAAASDPYGLYNSTMARTDYGSGISRSGSSGSYTYAVDSAFVNRPVNYVSWYGAARYTNWLTTGNTETGVYTFSGGTLQSIMDHQTAGATYGTAYFIPTEGEWYKAAYHDKAAGTAGTYFLYPTSNNTAPGQDMADVSGNNANCYTDPYVYPIDSGKYTTVGGEFQNSDSPYGTFDQGGNVWEWNETLVESSRCLRGGSFNNSSGFLASSVRSLGNPSGWSRDLGFRVASNEVVPEPGSIAMLLGLVGVGLLWWRRRR